MLDSHSITMQLCANSEVIWHQDLYMVYRSNRHPPSPSLPLFNRNFPVYQPGVGAVGRSITDLTGESQREEGDDM